MDDCCAFFHHRTAKGTTLSWLGLLKVGKLPLMTCYPLLLPLLLSDEHVPGSSEDRVVHGSGWPLCGADIVHTSPARQLLCPLN